MSMRSADPGADADGIVRRATAADAPAIAALYATLVDNPGIDVQPERVAALHADPATALLVFERAGTVLGTVLVALCADAMFGRRPFAVIENIVVAPASRGARVGERLLAQAETFCRDADCTKIMLLSAATRERAHAFFVRCGYDGSAKRGFVKYRRSFALTSAR